MLQDNGWFRTLLRDNVELVNERIARVTEHGVVTDLRRRAPGRRARARHRVPSEQVPVAHGDHRPRRHRLHDVWGDDPRAYLGITMPGFPNLFCLYGPNTNPVVGSVVFMLECQVNYVVQGIAAHDRGRLRVASSADATCTTSTTSGSTRSTSTWSGVTPRSTATTTTSHGRVTTNAPWQLIDYWRMTRAVRSRRLRRADPRGARMRQSDGKTGDRHRRRLRLRARHRRALRVPKAPAS